MCILLLTTHHPSYPLILLSNRDEYLHRPTARAHWWTPSTPPFTPRSTPPPNPNPTTNPTSSPSSPSPSPSSSSSSHVAILSGRDLARPEKGTWLGLTRTGRLAVLTNFSERTGIMGKRSRGGLVRRFLEGGSGIDEFVREIRGEWGEVGGFSLLVGCLRRGRDRLCVVSNRGSDAEGWVEGGEVVGLSNSRIEEPWPKVVKGREELEKVVERSVGEGWDYGKLVEELFGVLSMDDLREDIESLSQEEQLNSLQYSVFIRPFETATGNKSNGGSNRRRSLSSGKGDVAAAEDLCESDGPDETEPIFPGMEKSRLYGTQKQTLILVDKEGHAVYIERTLYDDDAKPVPENERDAVFEFQIEDWDKAPEQVTSEA